MLKEFYSIYLEANKLTGSLPNEFDQLTKLSYFTIGYNFLTGTLPKQIELLDISDVGFDEQFCQVCSEGFIPKSTNSTFTLKGNFACTDMFNIHNNNLRTIKNGDSLYNIEYLTMDQCASFKKECISCVDETKDLILS